MFRYDLCYYSNALGTNVSVPMVGPTLANAISQALAYDVLSVASDAFPISLWVRHITAATIGGAHTQCEIRLYNGQRSIPALPHEGSWRTDALQLLRNIEPQYGHSELEFQFCETFAQVLNLLVVTDSITAGEAEALCVAAEKFRSNLFIHRAGIEFSGYVRELYYELLRHMPPALRDSAKL